MSGSVRPSCWILTDGKAGDRSQCLGVAHHLQADIEERLVPTSGFRQLIAPYGSIPRSERSAVTGGVLSGPQPGLVIASGRRTVPYIRSLTRQTGQRPFTVFLKNPRRIGKVADVIWAPAHDNLSGPNVISTLTGPHSFSVDDLKTFADQARPQLKALASPRLVVLLGGNNRAVTFDAAAIIAFITGLNDKLGAVGSVLVSSSRRSPPRLVEATRELLKDHPHFFYAHGEPDNPYREFLGLADVFLITGDSHNMVSEATVTGKPIHVFRPPGLAKKFHRFLDALEDKRIVFPASGLLELTPYPSLNSSQDICDEILRRYEIWKRFSAAQPE